MLDSRKLKGRMVQEGYTQAKLAKEAGMSVNTLNSKVNGRTPFNCDEVDVLCDLLNIHAPHEKAEIFLA